MKEKEENTQENPNLTARRELQNLPISGRHAFNLETVVMADLERNFKRGYTRDDGSEL